MSAITIDIIILSFAKSKALQRVTENAITSLFTSEDPQQIDFKVLVIESNKSLSPFTYPATETVYPKADFNFNKYLNIGLKWSVNKYVCFCNNDLIFHTGWATEILEAFNGDPELQSASPCCPDFHGGIDFTVNSGLIYGHQIRNHVAGWCIFAKRSLFDKIGQFDEKFRFWFSDADYANTLKAKGLKHALVTSAKVTHLDGTSTEALHLKIKEALTAEQFWYYQYKWEHHNFLLYLYRRFRGNLRLFKIKQ